MQVIQCKCMQSSLKALYALILKTSWDKQPAYSGLELYNFYTIFVLAFWVTTLSEVQCHCIYHGPMIRLNKPARYHPRILQKLAVQTRDLMLRNDLYAWSETHRLQSSHCQASTARARWAYFHLFFSTLCIGAYYFTISLTYLSVSVVYVERIAYLA